MDWVVIRVVSDGVLINIVKGHVNLALPAVPHLVGLLRFLDPN